MTPKNMKIVIPEGCEVERIDTQDGAVVVTFKRKEPQLPKTWEEFCEMYPVKQPEVFIREGGIYKIHCESERDTSEDIATLPDRATAEAVLALCQLIQLRNAYNGDWVPEFTGKERIYTIEFYENRIWSGDVSGTSDILHFRSRELRDEFLRNFRNLIEKLKPLYGIKEGGAK